MMDRIALPITPKIETCSIILYPAVESGEYRSRAMIYATIDREGDLMECRGVFAGVTDLELVTFKWS